MAEAGPKDGSHVENDNEPERGDGCQKSVNLGK